MMDTQADCDGLEADLTTLTAAWRGVVGRAIHGPSCSCCGGQPVMLRADELAEGIEHALRVRYRANANSAHLQVLDACPLGDGEDFMAWVRRLAGIAERDITRDILKAIFAALDSIRQGPAIRR